MFGRRGAPKQSSVKAPQNEGSKITIDTSPKIPVLPRFPDKTMSDTDREKVAVAYDEIVQMWVEAMTRRQ